MQHSLDIVDMLTRVIKVNTVSKYLLNASKNTRVG